MCRGAFTGVGAGVGPDFVPPGCAPVGAFRWSTAVSSCPPCAAPSASECCANGMAWRHGMSAAGGGGTWCEGAQRPVMSLRLNVELGFEGCVACRSPRSAGAPRPFRRPSTGPCAGDVERCAEPRPVWWRGSWPLLLRLRSRLYRLWPSCSVRCTAGVRVSVLLLRRSCVGERRVRLEAPCDDRRVVSLPDPLERQPPSAGVVRPPTPRRHVPSSWWWSRSFGPPWRVPSSCREERSRFPLLRVTLPP